MFGSKMLVVDMNHDCVSRDYLIGLAMAVCIENQLNFIDIAMEMETCNDCRGLVQIINKHLSKYIVFRWGFSMN